MDAISEGGADVLQAASTTKAETRAMRLRKAQAKAQRMLEARSKPAEKSFTQPSATGESQGSAARAGNARLPKFEHIPVGSAAGALSSKSSPATRKRNFSPGPGVHSQIALVRSRADAMLEERARQHLKSSALGSVPSLANHPRLKGLTGIDDVVAEALLPKPVRNTRLQHAHGRARLSHGTVSPDASQRLSYPSSVAYEFQQRELSYRSNEVSPNGSGAGGAYFLGGGMLVGSALHEQGYFKPQQMVNGAAALQYEVAASAGSRSPSMQWGTQGSNSRRSRMDRGDRQHRHPADSRRSSMDRGDRQHRHPADSRRSSVDRRNVGERHHQPDQPRRHAAPPPPYPLPTAEPANQSSSTTHAIGPNGAPVLFQYKPVAHRNSGKSSHLRRRKAGRGRGRGRGGRGARTRSRDNRDRAQRYRESERGDDAGAPRRRGGNDSPGVLSPPQSSIDEVSASAEQLLAARKPRVPGADNGMPRRVANELLQMRREDATLEGAPHGPTPPPNSPTMEEQDELRTESEAPSQGTTAPPNSPIQMGSGAEDNAPAESDTLASLPPTSPLLAVRSPTTVPANTDEGSESDPKSRPSAPFETAAPDAAPDSESDEYSSDPDHYSDDFESASDHDDTSDDGGDGDGKTDGKVNEEPHQQHQESDRGTMTASGALPRVSTALGSTSLDSVNGEDGNGLGTQAGSNAVSIVDSAPTSVAASDDSYSSDSDGLKAGEEDEDSDADENCEGSSTYDSEESESSADGDGLAESQSGAVGATLKAQERQARRLQRRQERQKARLVQVDAGAYRRRTRRHKGKRRRDGPAKARRRVQPGLVNTMTSLDAGQSPASGAHTPGLAASSVCSGVSGTSAGGASTSGYTTRFSALSLSKQHLPSSLPRVVAPHRGMGPAEYVQQRSGASSRITSPLRASGKSSPLPSDSVDEDSLPELHAVTTQHVASPGLAGSRHHQSKSAPSLARRNKPPVS